MANRSQSKTHLLSFSLAINSLKKQIFRYSNSLCWNALNKVVHKERKLRKFYINLTINFEFKTKFKTWYNAMPRFKNANSRKKQNNLRTNTNCAYKILS
jgi:hypothetical protein